MEGEGNPGFRAGATFLRKIPVGVGEITPVNLQRLDALPDRIGNTHRHAIGEIGLAKDRTADGGYFVNGIVVGIRHDVPAGNRGNDGFPPAAKKLEQSRLEVLLLFKVVHPDHHVVLDGVGDHVDRPDLIAPLGRAFLGQGLREDVNNGRPHTYQGNDLGAVFEIGFRHVAVAKVAVDWITRHFRFHILIASKSSASVNVHLPVAVPVRMIFTSPVPVRMIPFSCPSTAEAVERVNTFLSNPVAVPVPPVAVDISVISAVSARACGTVEVEGLSVSAENHPAPRRLTGAAVTPMLKCRCRTSRYRQGSSSRH